MAGRRATGGTVLVAGASGVVGRAAAAHCAGLPGWRAIALSRRPPEPGLAAAHLAVDLNDAEAVGRALAAAAPVTHLVYAALNELPDLIAGWRQAAQIETNRRMLANLLAALERHAPGLRQVSLLQGTKAYGAHLHRIAIPAKERQPRDPHASFYWAQEDLLRAAAARHGWAVTVFRPQVVGGIAVGSPMNVTLALAVHAHLRRAAGEPLHFPGSRHMLTEATDADLLARAFAWAATEPAAGGATFNVTNGDPLNWWDLWPAIADAFDMPMGEARPERLAETMPARAAAWRSLAHRHGLASDDLARLLGASWQYLDFVLGNGLEHAPPTLLSTVAIRRAGFADCVDTEAMFRRQFRRLADLRLIPPS